MGGASGGTGCIEAVEAPIGLGNRSLPVQRRMQITEARRSLGMHRPLLHKRRLAAHSGDVLSLLVGKPSLCTIPVHKFAGMDLSLPTTAGASHIPDFL